MKYSFLEQMVREHAHELKEDAGYNGAWNDGGAGNLLRRLEEYKHSLVVKYDLRPSEYKQLNDKEVGEPKEFFEIIKQYKIKLALQIKL